MMLDRTASLTETRRLEQMILAGLLHSPGVLKAALVAGFNDDLIDDLVLRDVFRLIRRGPLAIRAAIRGSDVSPAAAAARALHAEIDPLDPARIVGLIKGLVEGVEFPDDDELAEDEVPDPAPRNGGDTHLALSLPNTTIKTPGVRSCGRCPATGSKSRS